MNGKSKEGTRSGIVRIQATNTAWKDTGVLGVQAAGRCREQATASARSPRDPNGVGKEAASIRFKEKHWLVSRGGLKCKSCMRCYQMDVRLFRTVTR